MRKYLCSGCFILVLAFSVFGWGLHSKLSLYETTQPATVATPIAKLLSEQERASADQAQQMLAAPVELPAVAVPLSAAVTPSIVVALQPQRDDTPVKPVAFRFDGPSLLRPPPFASLA